MGTDRYEITGRAELRTGPEIAFSRDSLHFSLLGIGESKTLPLTISSTGFAPLTVTVPTIPNRNFSWSPLQATLLPGQSVDLRVEFSPLASGRAEATLRVLSDAPGSPHLIPLTGSGRDEIPN